MKLDDSIFWLGSESSLRRVVAAQAEIQGKSYDLGEDESEPSRLLTLADGIATISVHGDLTNTDSFWNQFFGMTSYNEIRNGIIEAIQDEDVSRLILDIDTNGGDAKGVDDLSNFIVSARQHKPIDTYISGSAFSAGYWIASATENIYGAKMSEAGSIGVIAILMNRVKAMKDRGYEVTVFRGGKYKALGNPFEKLTETAKKIYQSKVDAMEGFFLDAVSENRDIPRSKVKSQVGEGLTFFAEEAVENGLMDDVISFDEFFNRLVKQSKTSSAAGRAILSEETDMKKKVLTAEAVAAVASGASADSEAVEGLLEEAASAEETNLDANAAEQGEETQASEQTLDPAASEEGEGTDEGSGEESASDGEEATQAADPSLVAYLKEEVKTLQASNATMAVDLEKYKGEASTAQANETALKEIVDEYVAGMSVGLGMSSISLKGMNTSVVLKQYEEVRSTFTSRFKVGSKAEVVDEEPESSGDGMSFMEQASVAANKI